MNARLENQIGIVTGSSSGNGRAIALAFWSAGATVVCADLNKKARKEGYEDDIEIDTDDVIQRPSSMPLFRQTHPIPKPRRYWSDDKIHALWEALIAS